MTQPTLHRGDIDGQILDGARSVGQVSWDIETTGLDWATDEIRTVQLAFADAVVIIQLQPWRRPALLNSLLEDRSVRKVFHHAPFDLRFMVGHWNARPANVACTKIAAKILDPGRDKSHYSLKPVLERHLGIVISKDQQVSDWSRDELSPAQLAYAASDVRYLRELLSHLLSSAHQKGLADLIESSFAYLPTRVRLDLSGAGDVFAY